MSKCINFGGGPRWQGKTGKVAGYTKDGWVNVRLDESPGAELIPFRERELDILPTD